MPTFCPKKRSRGGVNFMCRHQGPLPSCFSEVHLPGLPALGFSEVLPAFLGRCCEGEVDVATHIPVVFVLINQLRYEFRSEGDEEPLKQELCIRVLCELRMIENRLTLVMTANCASMSRIVNQIPMFSALSATARLVSQTNFCASSRISIQLF